MLFDKTLGVGAPTFHKNYIVAISQTFVNKFSFQQLFFSLSSTGRK